MLQTINFNFILMLDVDVCKNGKHITKKVDTKLDRVISRFANAICALC